MGNDHNKEKPKALSMDEKILEMKMAAKRFENESKRSNKEAEKHIAKARIAVKKGNDEDARLYLTQADQKQKEGTQLHRMANKVSFMAGNIKNQANNQEMQRMISGMIPIMQQQLQTSDNLLNGQNIAQFDDMMMKMQVNGMVLDELTNPNASNQTNIDSNLMMLKNEHFADMNKEANLNAFGNYQNMEQNTNFQTNDLDAKLNKL